MDDSPLWFCFPGVSRALKRDGATGDEATGPRAVYDTDPSLLYCQNAGDDDDDDVREEAAGLSSGSVASSCLKSERAAVPFCCIDGRGGKIPSEEEEELPSSSVTSYLVT